MHPLHPSCSIIMLNSQVVIQFLTVSLNTSLVSSTNILQRRILQLPRVLPDILYEIDHLSDNTSLGSGGNISNIFFYEYKFVLAVTILN